jgi:hypothetical protein
MNSSCLFICPFVRLSEPTFFNADPLSNLLTTLAAAAIFSTRVSFGEADLMLPSLCSLPHFGGPALFTELSGRADFETAAAAAALIPAGLLSPATPIFLQAPLKFVKYNFWYQEPFL